jgi:predicted porin
MFGGLKRTANRITIATALGLTLGIYAMHATPVKAADLGGDCCADLEQRVADLEATTVRKGTKKVSVTISGWVVKSFNVWDDGNITNTVVGDKDADLASRFAIDGSAQISPGWSAGFDMTVTAPGSTFGILGDQANHGLGGLNNDINTLYSYMYIKSDKWGTVSWGKVSPASDNPAVLADISGSVIESNAVWFEGPDFNLRPSGAKGTAGLSSLTWSAFLECYPLSGAGIGADCNGAPYDAVLYTSPTFGGFSLQASFGEDDVGDVAVFYNGDWGNFKTSAAYAYTHVTPHQVGFGNNISDDLNQVGATIMHVPSGLGVYGEYQHDSLSGASGPGTSDDVYYIKPFIKKGFTPLGDTTIYGEYGKYNNQMFLAGQSSDLCTVGFTDPLGGTETMAGTTACANNPGGIRTTGSDVQRWGAGVVQSIDSASLALFARWQHEDVNLDLINATTGANVNQNFDSFDIFQVGGIIFF